MTKEQHKNFKACLAKGIKVYLVPQGKGTYKKPPEVKIAVEQNGKVKLGTQLYNQASDQTTAKINELLAYLASK